MDKYIYLCILTKDSNVIKIPFDNLIKLDLFTSNFDNPDKLIDFIRNIFKISLYKEDILNIYVSYINLNNLKRFNLLVKYSCDDFILEDLIYKYSTYLKDNKDKIKNSPLIYIKCAEIRDYLDGLGISDREIDFLVKKSLSKGYKNKRDIYFMLKSIGIKVNIRIHDNTYKRLSLDKMNTKDEYLNYLLESSKDSDRYDDIKEEISSYDLEDISSLFEYGKEDVIDGFGLDNSKVSIEDIILFDRTRSKEYSYDKIKKDIRRSYCKGRKK